MTSIDNSADVNLEWEQFLKNPDAPSNDSELENNKIDQEDIAPESSDIYISTKTKIAYLNTEIDLKTAFWNLPVTKYHLLEEGIIKKQMKFSCNTSEQLAKLQNQCKNESPIDELIITQIINPSGRIKFKDVRKISIGLSKKDLLTYRTRKKGAFYNCFVVILRILWHGVYKEIHMKVFNTGKLEIPGIQDDECLEKALVLLTNILNKALNVKHITYIQENIQTVLINSNFNCGFYINRDKLLSILKYKYKINCCYDPCSYPGIQCEFYYDNNKVNQNGCKIDIDNDDSNNRIKVSFMIFRTGSVLIVGKCTETILYEIYYFIKNMLYVEYNNIKAVTPKEEKKNNKKKMPRKKIIYMQM